METTLPDLESAFEWAESMRRTLITKKKNHEGVLHPTDVLTMERHIDSVKFISKTLETIIDDIKLCGESIIEADRDPT